MNDGEFAETGSALLELLDSEEFYLRLREKPITKNTRLAISNFINKSMIECEWDRFKQHCEQNDLDPYHEFREAAISSYVRVSTLNERIRQYQLE
jgi:hypothetical protein